MGRKSSRLRKTRPERTCVQASSPTATAFIKAELVKTQDGSERCHPVFFDEKCRVCAATDLRSKRWRCLMPYPVIMKVHAGSIADELGIRPGDLLVAMNGEPVYDIFDFRFHMADAVLSLRIGKPDGMEWECGIEKDEREDLGLEFENPLIDQEHGCTNKCVFCFVDQLPQGMRDTLYFKDDDARLSFLYGTYINMTNMSE